MPTAQFIWLRTCTAWARLSGRARSSISTAMAGVEYAGRSSDFDPQRTTVQVPMLATARPASITPVATPRLRPGPAPLRWQVLRRQPRQLHCRYSCADRGNHRLLVSLLQRAQGQVPVRHAILLCNPQYLVRRMAGHRTDWTAWSSPRSATTCRKNSNGPASTGRGTSLLNDG